VSREDLFAPHSPGFASSDRPLASHSPAFEPSEGDDEPRGLLFGWHSLLFELSSLPFASSEAGGMPREEEGMAWQQEGTPSEGLYG
jgi:hypothetical protein